MRIGIPKESLPGETLVAATPRTVAKLTKLGYQVVVESAAGEAAKFSDTAYADAGATVGDGAQVWSSDVVAKINAPTDVEVAALTEGALLVSMLTPAGQPALLADLAGRGVSAMALDAVPRISRAQALDVLSTMSNIAGYRAVIEAAQEYGGMFAGQVTAAGKTKPANVFVIGAGVAGLAAIGAAGSLGAQVRAYDVRPEVSEQIESMGAQFVTARAAQQAVSSDGYASALTPEQEQLTAAMYSQECARADIVVTTALVRGHAPTTITADMVALMQPGSVIVDLAASGGGNCELTVPGTQITTDNGVIIIGYTDLSSRMPQHTSQLFATNIVNLMKLLTPAKDGKLVVDLDDEVQRGMTVVSAGQVLWPPPPVQVSALPAPASAPPVAPPDVDRTEQFRVEAELSRRKEQRQLVSYGLAAVLLTLAITFSPAEFLGHFTVFILAVFVGYYVISKVSHSLHTPLMAQTNAISGIILVGAILQIGSDQWWVTALAVVAATVAAINIFGGFLVAYRMIGMFRKEA